MNIPKFQSIAFSPPLKKTSYYQEKIFHKKVTISDNSVFQTLCKIALQTAMLKAQGETQKVNSMYVNYSKIIFFKELHSSNPEMALARAAIKTFFLKESIECLEVLQKPLVNFITSLQNYQPPIPK